MHAVGPQGGVDLLQDSNNKRGIEKLSCLKTTLQGGVGEKGSAAQRTVSRLAGSDRLSAPRGETLLLLPPQPITLQGERAGTSQGNGWRVDA